MNAIIQWLAKLLHWEDMPSTDNGLLQVKITPPPMNDPIPTPEPPVAPILAPQGLLWDTPRHAWHSTRVMCDSHGLSLAQKNLICSVIYQESGFENKAVHVNKTPYGKIMSSDWGICQINDYWHIGKGKDFPTVDYVIANPDKAVEFMLGMFAHNKLGLWVAYSSKEYLKWLSIDSRMWSLAQ